MTPSRSVFAPPRLAFRCRRRRARLSPPRATQIELRSDVPQIDGAIPGALRINRFQHCPPSTRSGRHCRALEGRQSTPAFGRDSGSRPSGCAIAGEAHLHRDQGGPRSGRGLRPSVVGDGLTIFKVADEAEVRRLMAEEPLTHQARHAKPYRPQVGATRGKDRDPSVLGASLVALS